MTTHLHDLSAFQHEHAFAADGVQQRERAMAWVTAITVVTMVAELVAGYWSGSLALTADGWHMGTHALALGGAVLAYRLSARAASQAGYAFGGWKIEVLSAYTSGLLLLAVSLMLVFDAVDVLRHPRPIAYAEAMGVAVLGLVVNVVSAWLLSRGAKGDSGAAEPHRHDAHADHGHAGHGHGHGHGSHGHVGHAHDDPGHSHGGHDPVEPARAAPARAPAPAQSHAQSHAQAHGHSHAHAHGHGHDHNFSAAYVHVLADAITSVLAIGALAGGLWFGWRWLDPVVALLGAALIGQWAYGVLKSTSRALVDATEDPALTQRVRELIEADGDSKLSDLHVWQIGGAAWSAVVSIVADHPESAAAYRQRLAAVTELRHVTVEVHRCPGAAPEGIAEAQARTT